MRATFPQTMTLGTVQIRMLRLSRERALPAIALAGIVALAAALRFANLAALGYANHYYAAAVDSMLRSWHNFFFVAAEPGGSVSVDKPPVGLWLQAASAHFLCVDGFGLLLPQIVAGILSVLVVYHLVRRSFGMVAGLLAALAMAITPVVVAVDRNNTIDSTLILTLLLAAWAFIKATEEGKLRYLLLGVALAGIGFNIKMLEAYLPLPALYALYLLGSKERLWRKVPNLALATALLLVVSLSWATIVDLTPADQRPYVGSSGDNSELSLIVGYNGLERLLGMRGLRGGIPGLGSLLGGNPTGTLRDGRPAGGPGPDGNGAFPQLGPRPDGTRAQVPPGGFGGFGGIDGTGRPGPLRLFSVPLSKEVSWLLPFGIFSMGLLAFRSRLRWPIAPKHQAIVLWGGWLLTDAVFFSIAGFFHQYYLATMAAPLAALVGIGIVELWRLRERHPWWAAILLLAASGITLWLQVATATAFAGAVWWLPLALGLFVAGAILSVVAARRDLRRGAIAGFGLVVAALLLTPGIWAGLTTLNPSPNQSLPAAYDGRSSAPANHGGLAVNRALLQYLQANTQGMTFLMAVPSSMQGADYVLATGRPVLYLGGFMGQDHVVSAADLARLVADGQLRYIYWNGSGRGGFGGGFGGQADVSSWVTANCTPVQGFDTTTRNAGAPDGTGAGQSGQPAFGPGGMQVSLYECGGGS